MNSKNTIHRKRSAIIEYQFILFHIQFNVPTLLQLAEENFIRQYIFDIDLEDSGQWTSAILRIVPFFGQPLSDALRLLQGDLLDCQLIGKFLHELVDDHAHDLTV